MSWSTKPSVVPQENERIAFGANPLEQVDVAIPVPPEIEAEVEERLAEGSFRSQKQRY